MLGRQQPAEGFSPVWDSSEDLDFCDCPGPPPPPKFVIPPPPPSPSSPLCQGARQPSSAGGPPHEEGGPPLLQFCSMEPVGAEFTQAAFPSLPIIAVCSSVVLVAVLVASFLLWKHKRKVQNFLPCKSQGRVDLPVGPTGGITYDDVLINHHPTRLPNHHQPSHLTTDTLTPIELLDVKYGNYIQQHPDTLTRTNFAIPASNKDQRVSGNGSVVPEPQTRNQSHRNHHRHNAKKKDHFHPIYEEVSAASDENKAHANGHSYDSDIEDSEIEGRTVASEDEFAEDELSVAGEYQPSNQGEDPSQAESASSSLRGSTGGDLYPDVVSGSNERFCADQDSRNLKNVFRSLELGSGLKKHTHSLERNKDGHPSNSFQAKQNYYLNKSMLGPDFTFSEGDVDSSQTLDSQLPVGQQDFCSYPVTRPTGSSMNLIPVVLQQRGPLSSRSASNSPPPPPYTSCTNPLRGPHGSQGPNKEVISALYNPHIVSPTMTSRLPDSVLRELSYKLPGNAGVPVVSSGAMSSRSLPVPPSCRAGGSGMLFTVDNPYPPPSAVMSRARSGSVTEFGAYPHQQQQQHTLGGGRPPTPPPPENIYASIDDSLQGGGPFTIDGSRHRGTPFVQSRKGSADFRNTFGRNRPLAPKVGSSEAPGAFEPHSRNPDQEPGPYGDIRSNYDSRTACS